MDRQPPAEIAADADHERSAAPNPWTRDVDVRCTDPTAEALRRDLKPLSANKGCHRPEPLDSRCGCYGPSGHTHGRRAPARSEVDVREQGAAMSARVLARPVTVLRRLDGALSVSKRASSWSGRYSATLAASKPTPYCCWLRNYKNSAGRALPCPLWKLCPPLRSVPSWKCGIASMSQRMTYDPPPQIRGEGARAHPRRRGRASDAVRAVPAKRREADTRRSRGAGESALSTRCTTKASKTSHTGRRLVRELQAKNGRRSTPKANVTKVEDLDLFAWVGEDEFGSGEIGLKQGLVPAGCIPLVAVTEQKMSQPYIVSTDGRASSALR